MSVVNVEKKRLEAGLYEFHISHAETKESKKGNPYVRWRLVSKEGSCVLYYNTPIAGKKEILYREVFEASNVEFEAGVPALLECCVGKSIWCEVAYQEYNKASWLNVVKVMKTNESGSQV